jgi:hypothetical protein
MNASAKRAIIVRIVADTWLVVILLGPFLGCYLFCISGLGPMRWLPRWLSHRDHFVRAPSREASRTFKIPQQTPTIIDTVAQS